MQKSPGAVLITRLFFPLADSRPPPCQSTLLRISLRWRLADRPILGTSALPFPHCRPSAPFTYNIIQMQSLCYPITSPRCLLQLTLDSSFWFFFFYPHSTKCGPQLVTAGQKTSESASCLGFLGTLIYCQCRKKWQRGRKTGEVVEAEGGYTNMPNKYGDLSINQAVTTRRPSNWIVPGSRERAQTIFELGFIELLNHKRRTVTFKGTFSRLVSPREDGGTAVWLPPRLCAD